MHHKGKHKKTVKPPFFLIDLSLRWEKWKG